MSTDKKTFGERLRNAFRVFRRSEQTPRAAARSAEFALIYSRFREMLSRNHSTLEVYADLEEKLSGRRPFSMDTIEQEVRKAALDVFVMVKNLNQITAAKHNGLYESLARLSSALEEEFAGQRQLAGGPLVMPLAELRARDAKLAGNKMANLGEVGTLLGLAIPAGFCVTTRAFSVFMSENDLWTRSGRLEGILELEGPPALADAAREVQQAILTAPIPAEVEQAILQGYEVAFGTEMVLTAVRSSAVGEDAAGASHAGQYLTKLRVTRDTLLRAYREVVASAFGPGAVTYRFERGLSNVEAAMAVGCIQMVEPRCAGILFSRLPDDSGAEAVLISSTPGVADGVASGTQGAEIVRAVPGQEGAASSSLLSRAEVARLVHAARMVEAHFGRPQDMEWAIDGTGKLFVLQARPMVLAARETAATCAEDGRPPLLAGGATGCPGVGSGPVVLVREDEDLDTFPGGGVLVAKYSSPAFSRVMRRCVAIVDDVGSPTGHMAILAREFGVPAIVGLEGATRRLSSGRVVTVDATRCCVFEGALVAAGAGRPGRPALARTPALQALERVSELVTPLHLTDPEGHDFSPEGCRSLHDITRYVHEKIFETMFHCWDQAATDARTALKLDVRLPLNIRVFDLGGGIVEDTDHPGRLKPEAITSAPLRAFLEGLQDQRIRWDHPRPVSMRGFLSVMGESMMSPPAEAQGLGRDSYAVISDRYMNFSTKTGYHFSAVDSFCEPSPAKNYIHFRFVGGAADEQRRARRIRFLSTVLRDLDFTVRTHRDLLVARLSGIDQERTHTRLADLGRLTLCARQMDMLMDSDGSPDLFAGAFLRGEWDHF